MASHQTSLAHVARASLGSPAPNRARSTKPASSDGAMATDTRRGAVPSPLKSPKPSISATRQSNRAARARKAAARKATETAMNEIQASRETAKNADNVVKAARLASPIQQAERGGSVVGAFQQVLAALHKDASKEISKLRLSQRTADRVRQAVRTCIWNAADAGKRADQRM